MQLAEKSLLQMSSLENYNGSNTRWPEAHLQRVL